MSVDSKIQFKRKDTNTCKIPYTCQFNRDVMKLVKFEALKMVRLLRTIEYCTELSDIPEWAQLPCLGFYEGRQCTSLRKGNYLFSKFFSDLINWTESIISWIEQKYGKIGAATLITLQLLHHTTTICVFLFCIRFVELDLVELCDFNRNQLRIPGLTIQWLCFCNFVFKNRLIRLGCSFPFYSQCTKSLSGVITTTPQSHLWVRDTEKFPVAFSHAISITASLVTRRVS